MNVITPQQVGRVLQAIDQMGLHREAVRIPLETVPGGAVAIEAGAAVIEVPSDVDLEVWLSELPARLRAIPGSEGLREAEEL
ncbi:MAG: hypothetical protein CMJ90_04950 [Planctomycetes bacterium]|nr:hypothetical protein [Planctomycetota bacterium]